MSKLTKMNRKQRKQHKCSYRHWSKIDNASRNGNCKELEKRKYRWLCFECGISKPIANPKRPQKLVTQYKDKPKQKKLLRSENTGVKNFKKRTR